MPLHHLPLNSEAVKNVGAADEIDAVELEACGLGRSVAQAAL